jgi:hypothetical protein
MIYKLLEVAQDKGVLQDMYNVAVEAENKAREEERAKKAAAK